MFLNNRIAEHQAKRKEVDSLVRELRRRIKHNQKYRISIEKYARDLQRRVLLEQVLAPIKYFSHHQGDYILHRKASAINDIDQWQEIKNKLSELGLDLVHNYRGVVEEVEEIEDPYLIDELDDIDE